MKPTSSNLFRWVETYAGIVLALAFLALAGASPLTTRWVDFPVYWDAGQKAVLRSTVYDVVGHFQYKYSPFVALLFGKAFSPFSFETASWIFQKTMLALWTALFIRVGGARPTWILVLGLFFGNALRLDLALGQVNALVATLLFFLFESLEEDKEPEGPSWKGSLRFGAVFSMAVQLKLFVLILVPVLLLRGEWRKLLCGFLFLPLLSIGGVALYSGLDFALSENLAWFRSLTASTDELLLDPQNIAVLGTFGKLLGLTPAKALWGIAGAAFLSFLVRNRERSVEWTRNRSFAAIAFLNPLVWSYWILFLLPLGGELLRAGRVPLRSLDPRRGGREAARCVATAFVFFAFASQHAKWAWNGGIFVAMCLFVLASFERTGTNARGSSRPD